jgi:hypothetical protein
MTCECARLFANYVTVLRHVLNYRNVTSHPPGFFLGRCKMRPVRFRKFANFCGHFFAAIRNVMLHLDDIREIFLFKPLHNFILTSKIETFYALKSLR